MVTANEVLASTLYTEVQPFIKSIPGERLLYELCLALNDEDTEIAGGLLSYSIDEAFTWATSPQDHEFWSQLNQEFYQNKEEPEEDYDD